eukprot:10111090-Alexandrium_andersonii.AAC.1
MHHLFSWLPLRLGTAQACKSCGAPGTCADAYHQLESVAAHRENNGIACSLWRLDSLLARSLRCSCA